MAALQLRILLLLSAWVLTDHAVSVHSSVLEGEEKVTFLPGYDGPLPFELFTGYITVNETAQDHMFYYFVKSENNAAEDPLVLWITGGPGCSGVCGLFFEIGPLRFKVGNYNGSLPTLLDNPYSFTKVASIIFIDSPTGTGFSYSLTKAGYKTGDYRAVDEAYTFLNMWLSGHTECSSNPLYIGGDSYGGMIVSLLTSRIAEGIEEGNKLLSNLKGYFMGNPIVNTWFNVSRVEFAHQMGMVPHDLYQATKKSCNGQYYHPTNEECAKNVEIVEALYADINPKQVLEYYCGDLWSPKPGWGVKSMWRALNENQNYLSPIPIPPLECVEEYAYFLGFIYFNDLRVQNALHVRQETILEWTRCNRTLKDNYKAFEVEDTLEYHRNLTTQGYRLLVYSGDHDLLAPHIGTEIWIARLNYSVVEKWHPWFIGSQVAGYTRKYAHDLTYATVKGGGHTAPKYRPKECYAMIQRWLSKQPL